MDKQALLFWLVAILTGGSAVAVVVTTNIVRSATWLLFALGGTAAVFFLMGADFVGATQLLVYVGGTLVLVVFGVMLTAQGPFISMKTGAAEWAVSLIVGGLLYVMLALSIVSSSGNLIRTQPGLVHPADSAHSRNSIEIGESLLGIEAAMRPAQVTGASEQIRKPVSYLLPFEIISVHLLVVLIGAAYLARAKRRRGAVVP
jgi:NADH-quinone oxidoreductase subunit J